MDSTTANWAEIYVKSTFSMHDMLFDTKKVGVNRNLEGVFPVIK